MKAPNGKSDNGSMPLAERWLQWASLAYIAFLAMTVVLTLVIHQLSKRVTDAKDRELKQYQAESAGKIATAQVESAKAMEIAEAEKLARVELESQVALAEARAAEANLAATQAQLELEKLKEPRTIAPEDQDRLIAELKRFTGQNYSFSVFQDPEAMALLRVLDVMLKSAGWHREPSPNWYRRDRSRRRHCRVDSHLRYLAEPRAG